MKAINTLSAMETDLVTTCRKVRYSASFQDGQAAVSKTISADAPELDYYHGE